MWRFMIADLCLTQEAETVSVYPSLLIFSKQFDVQLNLTW